MITIPGLNHGDVEALAHSIAPFVELDDAQISDRFARAAWTVIAEAGDATAAALISSVGAAPALELVLHHINEATVPDNLHDDKLDPESMSAAIQRWQPRVSLQQVIRSIELAARHDVSFITPADECWPVGFDGPKHFVRPTGLWTVGAAAAIYALRSTTRSVALEGSRAATGYGETIASEFSQELAERAITIVNGGGFGIAGTALRGALRVPAAAVVAVAGGGVDRPYPSGHTALFKLVAERGAVVAEVPCGVPPTRYRFFRSNELKAAMSEATVIVEAGHRSGSLNLAGHASGMGRPLGAVPGPVTSAASAGCHRLLRDHGAACITSSSDVLELLGSSESTSVARTEVARANHRTLDELEPTPALALEL